MRLQLVSDGRKKGKEMCEECVLYDAQEIKKEKKINEEFNAPAEWIVQ